MKNSAREITHISSKLYFLYNGKNKCETRHNSNFLLLNILLNSLEHERTKRYQAAIESSRILCRLLTSISINKKVNRPNVSSVEEGADLYIETELRRICEIRKASSSRLVYSFIFIFLQNAAFRRSAIILVVHARTIRPIKSNPNLFRECHPSGRKCQCERGARDSPICALRNNDLPPSPSATQMYNSMYLTDDEEHLAFDGTA